MKTLDLHGQNRFEAKVNIKTFIKESFVNREKYVIITHGYGKLVLKETLYEVVENLECIEKIEDAPYQLGGSGSTLITLKPRSFNGKRIRS